MNRFKLGDYVTFAIVPCDVFGRSTLSDLQIVSLMLEDIVDSDKVEALFGSGGSALLSRMIKTGVYEES